MKAQSAQTGRVFLVGAGPGDPGLITKRGQECLAIADLVLYDGLVNPLILLNVPAQAERTSRAASRECRSLHQAEINARIIAAAREGKTVVRLKGGDPFTFGRGGEEAAALADAGIRFEVVPGVTAALGASAYAGIALTHREYASAVAFVTGHEDPSYTRESSPRPRNSWWKIPLRVSPALILRRLPSQEECIYRSRQRLGQPHGMDYSKRLPTWCGARKVLSVAFSHDLLECAFDSLPDLGVPITPVLAQTLAQNR